MKNTILVIDIGLFQFSVSSYVSLVGCIFKRNLSNLSVFSNHYHKGVHNAFLVC